MFITVLPAYGRDYKTAKAARADWDAGKDFLDASSRKYLSKRDIDPTQDRVSIRYAAMRKIVNV